MPDLSNDKNKVYKVVSDTNDELGLVVAMGLITSAHQGVFASLHIFCAKEDQFLYLTGQCKPMNHQESAETWLDAKMHVDALGGMIDEALPGD